MFPIIGTFHLTIGTEWSKVKACVIIVVENTYLHISRILVTGPKLIRSRKSAHLIGVVVDAEVDMKVVLVADAKVTAISGETIRGMGI